MANTTLLLNGLKNYNNSLQKHIKEVYDEFQDLSNVWWQFREVYEGQAADEFSNEWNRVDDMFKNYLRSTDNISRYLGSKINELEELDKPDLGI